MNVSTRVRDWVAAGKQVGARRYMTVNGRRMYVAVGVQRCRERVRVAVREIEEQFMAGEEYERDELIDFETVDSAADYVDAHTHVNFSELAPLRGNQVFDPETSRRGDDDNVNEGE